MQDSLFPEPDDEANEAAPAPRPARAPRSARGAKVLPAAADATHREIAQALPPRVRLGTSSWNYPGWTGLVWDRDYPESTLSKHGLKAYAQHALMRTVSLDRAFYRPLSVDQYAGYAAQVPDDFRFIVKAPSVIADALVRGEDGRGLQSNPHFLDPDLAVRTFAQPALEGLRHRLGVLHFQLSPIPASIRQEPDRLMERLDALLRALPRLDVLAPDAVVAAEVRDADLLTPAFAHVLRRNAATYSLGLHAKMPPIDEQLPMLRALWPGPLVCRWLLHRKHGAFGYEEAKRLYGNFDHIVDADPETREALAKVIAATAQAGHPVYVALGNKAEGSAPLSVVALAEAVTACVRQPTP